MKNMQGKITIVGAADDATRLALLQKEAAKLARRLGKGTSDVTEEAGAAVRAHARVGGELSIPLAVRMEEALRVHPRSLEELARDLKEPVGRVSAAMKTFRKQLFNAGTEHAPAWFWIVGDDAPTEQVNAAVEALVSYRPMRFPELIAATGARQGRVSGAIVKMQRDPKSRLTNLDSDSRARWFVVPPGIQLAKLKAR